MDLDVPFLKFEQNIWRCVSVCKFAVFVVCVCVCICFVSRYGHFSGINRKVQLTYLRNGQPKASSEEEGTNTWAVLGEFCVVRRDYWREQQRAPVFFIFFKTLRRTARLCCLCWSGAASWRLQAGFRLKSWAGPSAACTPEVKVPAGHIHTHADRCVSALASNRVLQRCHEGGKKMLKKTPFSAKILAQTLWFLVFLVWPPRL